MVGSPTAACAIWRSLFSFACLLLGEVFCKHAVCDPHPTHLFLPPLSPEWWWCVFFWDPDPCPLAWRVITSPPLPCAHTHTHLPAPRQVGVNSSSFSPMCACLFLLYSLWRFGRLICIWPLLPFPFHLVVGSVTCTHFLSCPPVGILSLSHFVLIFALAPTCHIFVFLWTGCFSFLSHSPTSCHSSSLSSIPKSTLWQALPSLVIHSPSPSPSFSIIMVITKSHLVEGGNPILSIPWNLPLIIVNIGITPFIDDDDDKTLFTFVVLWGGSDRWWQWWVEPLIAFTWYCTPPPLPILPHHIHPLVVTFAFIYFPLCFCPFLHTYPHIPPLYTPHLCPFPLPHICCYFICGPLPHTFTLPHPIFPLHSDDSDDRPLTIPFAIIPVVMVVVVVTFDIFVAGDVTVMTVTGDSDSQWWWPFLPPCSPPLPFSLLSLDPLPFFRPSFPPHSPETFLALCLISTVAFLITIWHSFHSIPSASLTLTFRVSSSTSHCILLFSTPLTPSHSHSFLPWSGGWRWVGRLGVSPHFFKPCTASLRWLLLGGFWWWFILFHYHYLHCTCTSLTSHTPLPSSAHAPL